MNHKEETFICECGAEILLVMVWAEEDPRFNEVNFAMFRCYNVNPNLWERIKYAYWHLKTGKRHLDEITFTHEQAGRLADFLIKNIHRED